MVGIIVNLFKSKTFVNLSCFHSKIIDVVKLVIHPQNEHVKALDTGYHWKLKQFKEATTKYSKETRQAVAM